MVNQQFFLLSLFFRFAVSLFHPATYFKALFIKFQATRRMLGA